MASPSWCLCPVTALSDTGSCGELTPLIPQNPLWLSPPPFPPVQGSGSGQDVSVWELLPEQLHPDHGDHEPAPRGPHRGARGQHGGHGGSRALLLLLPGLLLPVPGQAPPEQRVTPEPALPAAILGMEEPGGVSCSCPPAVSPAFPAGTDPSGREGTRPGLAWLLWNLLWLEHTAMFSWREPSLECISFLLFPGLCLGVFCVLWGQWFLLGRTKVSLSQSYPREALSSAHRQGLHSTLPMEEEPHPDQLQNSRCFFLKKRFCYNIPIWSRDQHCWVFTRANGFFLGGGFSLCDTRNVLFLNMCLKLCFLILLF